MFTKTLVLVDAGVDVRDTAEVLYRIAANTDPAHDVFLQPSPGGESDGAAEMLMGVDATRKQAARPPAAAREVTMSDAVRRAVAQRWDELALPAAIKRPGAAP